MIEIDFLHKTDSHTVIKELNKFDLTEIAELQSDLQYKKYLLEGAGVEHYKLLAYLASLFPDQYVMDIGTHFGNSSLALAMPGTINVISYDIADYRKLKRLPKKVIYRVGDFREDEHTLKCPFIFIDVDPHDGIQEKAFHEFFLENNYKGMVFWDDINANDAMKEWWNSITTTKYDLTAIGHWSGTGMIDYAG